MNRLPGQFWLIMLLLLWLMPVDASAKELKVEEGRSIQNAIDQAAAGDTLTISQGTYKENIVINKRIALIGEHGAIIDGGGKGNVIEVLVSDVIVKGLRIQNSGSGQEDSGIFIKKADGNIIENNSLNNVHNGIYIANSKDNQIVKNSISSYESHFSKRGNGIHMFKGGGHLLKENEITAVQDGIYYDFTEQIKVTGNHVSDSRYGMHFMFSKGVSAGRNHIEKNVTGFMVMDSSDIKFIENRVTDHFHFRGFGILIYETKNILVERNEILRNSTGLSLENGENISINKNLIAANQVGLEFVGKNKKNLFAENNFIGNVVQSKISGEDMRLDDGLKGNYWDDYSSFDLSGDGIGEEAYKAGSLYDRILRKQPYWQFFFESPSVKLWTKAESLFPSFGSAEVYDARPLVAPAAILPSAVKQDKGQWRSGLIGIIFMVIALFVIMKGRKFR
ncbi:nitrous oxide reductase family maturation protein NosD [Mesobacillus thioparans]|uniref:nitrous oxide reductase family maturation protein NosD n=1 Tax=Mesobacillus thioparans TaxID=370439 RepID=UPI0039EE229F